MKRMLKRGLVWGFLGLVGLGATMPSLAWDKGNLADYHGRRAQLVRETRDGVVSQRSSSARTKCFIT